jgi:hypothetical protein
MSVSKSEKNSESFAEFVEDIDDDYKEAARDFFMEILGSAVSNVAGTVV